MNKQELKQKIKELPITHINNIDTQRHERRVKIGSVLELVDQLDEPEKPVVPKFVAKEIEDAKENKKSLLDLFKEVIRSGLVDLDADNWIEENSNTFARAWLDGYEVEKEKRYRLRIENSLLDGNFSYLNYHSAFDRYSLNDANESGDYKTSFTESELKSIDETGFVRVEVTS